MQLIPETDVKQFAGLRASQACLSAFYFMRGQILSRFPEMRSLLGAGRGEASIDGLVW